MKSVVWRIAKTADGVPFTELQALLFVFRNF